MPEDRRHAAIMFTDIVGYTALMGKDEDSAFDMLRRNHSLHQDLIEKHNGNLIKEIGDGTLATFPLASHAVRCAIDIQKEAKDQNIPLKIGIHEGEMVFAGSDVIGDSVNIASRLQEDAQAGCINISASVYRDIKNQADIKTKFFEEKTLKNVDEPIKIYKVISKDYEKEDKTEMSKTKDNQSSIAVLPFVNMSNDPEQEYFCDGITEEIINALSHVGSIKVIARTSAFMFKGKHKDIREIGKKLDVETLLEGSVRKAGNRLRITAQLVKVFDGSHIWSDAYNRELEDVFEIQEEISLAIVDNLKVKLLGKERTTILKRYTEDLEAYNLILKGNYYCQMMTAEGFKNAIECFEQSLQKDSNYALGYSGLASVFWYISYWGNVPPNKAYPKSKEYAKKALEIDNTLAEAHAALGFVHMNYDWNWKLAEQEYKKAIKLNPNSALIYMYYSFLLTFEERYKEAISKAKQAQELDPLNFWMNTNACLSLIWGGHYDESIDTARMTITMNPNYFYSHYILGVAYNARSMTEEAMKEYEKAVNLSGGIPRVVTGLAIAYYEFGKKAKAEKLIDSIKKRSGDEYVPSTCFYWIHKARGDLDQAYKWLERAVNEHDSFLPWIIGHPDENMKIPDEPRFNELMKKVGLKRRRT
jgi:TolB-like protein/Flp pilus assembly protein TadD